MRRVKTKEICARLPLLLAIVTALAVVGCKPSSPPPAADATAVTSAETVNSTPEAVTTSTAASTTLVELDEAARSVATVPSGMCSFDKLGDERFTAGMPGLVSDPAAFMVTGWVGDKATMSRPEASLRIAEVSGRRMWEIGVGPGKGRGDVATHFKNDGLKNAGFQVAADLTALPAGEYALSAVYDDGSRRIACDKGTRIQLGG